MEYLDRNLDEDQKIPPRPLWVRILRGIIALIAVMSLLYLSGIYQYFFLQRTSDSIEQPLLVSKVNAEDITIPVMIHVLTGDRGSDRTEEDAQRLVNNANNIWAQGSITFAIREINYIRATNSDLQKFRQNPHEYIEDHGSYNPQMANIYFIRTLSGVNGLAYGGTNAVSLADYTSTLDFRTLAHEFGHLLGLDHVSDNRRLMATGGRGTDLSKEEIEVARNNAQEEFTTNP